MSMVYDAFTKNGIGVVVGEYGLLGYDAGDECNQPGEELKYYEYMNELSRKYGLCLMFWDNGSGIDRRSGGYQWKKPLVGAMLEASMAGRSSYAAGLDTLYFAESAAEDVVIPLTLNGNTFTGIDGLTEGTEYTYDSSKAAVTLKAGYINRLFEAKDGYGEMAVLTLQFSSGADWQETLVKYTEPVFSSASGTASDGLVIPAAFNGAELRRITAYAGEDRTGPNSSWWGYLQYTETFQPDYAANTLTIKPSFFNECAEGEIKLVIEFYDGQTAEITLNKDGGTVTAGKEPAPETPAASEVVKFADVKDDAWYQEAVEYVVSKGIMTGVSRDAFAPESAITRAQMAQAVSSLGGMLAGDNSTITRIEAVEALYSCAKQKGEAGDLSAYADAENLSGSALHAMRWAVGQKIIAGKSSSILDPDGTATRAEIAVMIMRFCEAG